MKEYIVHLIGEVSKFVLDSNPSRLVISLHKEEDGLHLSVMDNIERSDRELRAMEKSLNSEKRPELSEYYGSMAGHDLLGTPRLNLIGWQVKHSDVGRIDGGTKIDFWLGSNRFDPTFFNIPEKKKE
jgi:hypothetical protein